MTERSLPAEPDDLAPDGSDVRLLCAVPAGSMAHFTLGRGLVSVAQRHRTVSELWYVVGGEGRLWRRFVDGTESVIALRAGVSLRIEVGTGFQFRADDDPLTIVGVTMPPWPGADEAIAIPGYWEPVL